MRCGSRSVSGARSVAVVRWVCAGLAAVALAGCGSGPERRGEVSGRQTATYDYGSAPTVRDAAAPSAVTADGRAVVRSLSAGSLDGDALRGLAASGDARQGWLLSDLLRFAQSEGEERAIVDAFAQLTGRDPRRDPAFARSAWSSVTNHLIAWNLPAASGYVTAKALLFTAIEPGWRAFFADRHADVDWRLVSWGGVPIDARPVGDPKPCPSGCIPALDDPKLTVARHGDWYDDDAIVFGIVVGDQAVALPRNIMEVHEMVNITIAGRRLGVPYCTLCASAQAYFTDRLPGGLEPAVLRTSGLLSRSNKVMYELRTRSVFDTFTGRALSGPLYDARVTLKQTSVVASTWGAWKRAHPATRIVARDGGIGRDYPSDPLRGRDEDGPIFPVGPVDPRLPVQERVTGVIARDGTPVAFASDQARRALSDGRRVALRGVRLLADGSGLRALDQEGALVAHEAFWFAWSQFHPTTTVWIP